MAKKHEKSKDKKISPSREYEAASAYAKEYYKKNKNLMNKKHAEYYKKKKEEKEAIEAQREKWRIEKRERDRKAFEKKQKEILDNYNKLYGNPYDESEGDSGNET